MNASKRDFIVAALSSMSSALAESSKFSKRRRILSMSSPPRRAGREIGNTRVVLHLEFLEVDAYRTVV